MLAEHKYLLINTDVCLSLFQPSIVPINWVVEQK